jgi:hypothetical protein
VCEIGCLVTTGASTVVGTSLDAYILLFSICTQHASCLYPLPIHCVHLARAYPWHDIHLSFLITDLWDTVPHYGQPALHPHTWLPVLLRVGGSSTVSLHGCECAREGAAHPGSGLPWHEHRSRSEWWCDCNRLLPMGMSSTPGGPVWKSTIPNMAALGQCGEWCRCAAALPICICAAQGPSLVAARDVWHDTRAQKCLRYRRPQL